MKKRILITGKNGYVGKCLYSFLESNGYIVDNINVRDRGWKVEDFSQYDVLIHLAAIVHNNTPNAKMIDFMNVNYHLTKELAGKAKNEGVKQFIFFSTMSVFGLEGEIGKKVVINKDTKKIPRNAYGISKLRAEEMLSKINSNDFKVAIVRPPMIYGREAPGNFDKLIKVSKILPFYPAIYNERSSIYIENLEIYVQKLIEHQNSGIFHPQNNYYLNTNDAISKIRDLQRKKTIIIKIPKFVLKYCSKSSLLNKLYGNLTYCWNIDEENYNNQFIDKTESYIRTVE
ncbi:NAD-dependent epimerase/dehydratase family protein [Mammaliicoccus sciuri]|uniref:NAD-dependent epimerase/dehydratase family protein n=1 Tax=Mammaliicoccus sciuri TaxID=1296 RepID=UPI001299CF36|nr:NAD-dependent epimerase/dehydratase family protein [Mammaliicoccus sciuri]MRE71923.1 NAD-dependent epimerase/dehydratase family protein [Mammaliicoccus sciuri]